MSCGEGCITHQHDDARSITLATRRRMAGRGDSALPVAGHDPYRASARDAAPPLHTCPGAGKRRGPHVASLRRVLAPPTAAASEVHVCGRLRLSARQPRQGTKRVAHAPPRHRRGTPRHPTRHSTRLRAGIVLSSRSLEREVPQHGARGRTAHREGNALRRCHMSGCTTAAKVAQSRPLPRVSPRRKSEPGSTAPGARRCETSAETAAQPDVSVRVEERTVHGFAPRAAFPCHRVAHQRVRSRLLAWVGRSDSAMASSATAGDTAGR